MDDELWMRYLCKYGQENIVLIDPLLAHFRLHVDSKTVSKGAKSFREERMAVFAYLANQLHIPNSIITKIADLGIDYYLEKPFDLNFLDQDKFIAHFSAEFQYTFYKDFDYQTAEYCMKKTLKYGTWEWSSRYISLIFKLLFVNRRLLNLVRKPNIISHE